MIDNTKEIKVVEHVISLLYQCLKMNIETSNKEGIKSCLKDIRTCKKELQRLNEIQLSLGVTKEVSGSNKGALINVFQ
jgi:hypothetical protein